MAIGYSEERDRIYDFNSETVISNWGQVYCRRGMRIDSILDLNGKKIAVVPEDIYYEEFKKLAEGFGINIRYVEVEGDYPEVFSAVEKGEAEAGIVSRIFGYINERNYDVSPTSIIFSPIELRFATPEGRNSHLLTAIDKNLREMKEQPDSAYYTSMNKWLEIRVEPEPLPQWVLWLFLTVLLFVCFLVFRNFYLEREVQKKKEELEKEYEERKRAEEMFRILVENQGEGVAIVDEKETFLFANPAAKSVFGVDELEGRNLMDFLDENERKKVIEQSKRRKLGEKGRYELEIIRPDGERRTLFVTATPYRDKNGKFLGAFAVFLDITERKEMERKLRESKAKYRKTAEFLSKMIDTSPIPITAVDTDLRITLWNRAAENFFGWRADEVVGKNLLYLQVPPEEKEKVESVFKEVLKKGTPVRNVNKNYTKDGKELLIEWYNFPIKENGEIVGVASIGLDLTERTRLIDKIVESEETLRSIFENTPNPILITDANGNIYSSNRAGEKVFGELIKKNVLELEKGEEILSHIKKCIETESMIEKELEINDRIFGVSFVPLELPESRCVMIIKDITEILRVNKLLRVINDINELIVREKDEEKLLRKASERLSSLKKYYSVWIGIREKNPIKEIYSDKKREGIKMISFKDETGFYPERLDISSLPCFINAVENKSIQIVQVEERSELCPFYSANPKISCLVLPMIIDSEILGFVILHTEKELPSKEEIELLQTLSNDLAFAVKSIEIDKAKKRAFEQINKNIEQFAILIDGIRNPLAIILGLTELRTDDDTKAIIMEQIKKIEMILKRLDEGWLDSEEMRDFLKRFEK